MVKAVALVWHLKMVQWVNNFRRFITGEEFLCCAVLEFDGDLLC